MSTAVFIHSVSYRSLHGSSFHPISQSPEFSSSFLGRNRISFHEISRIRVRETRPLDHRVIAMSFTEAGPFKMNLNEYMVTLEKPLGIRFALSVDGKIFVHALKKGVIFPFLVSRCLFIFYVGG